MKFLRDLFQIGDAVIAESELSPLEEALSHYPTDQAKKFSAIAMLLGRVAYADLNISDSEKEEMKTVLQAELGLNEEEAATITKLAVESTLASSLDQHIVLRVMNEFCTYQEKVNTVYSMFLVACVEDVSVAEHSQIKQVANALHIQPSDFSQLMVRFQEHLSVLK